MSPLKNYIVKHPAASPAEVAKACKVKLQSVYVARSELKNGKGKQKLTRKKREKQQDNFGVDVLFLRALLSMLGRGVTSANVQKHVDLACALHGQYGK